MVSLSCQIKYHDIGVWQAQSCSPSCSTADGGQYPTPSYQGPSCPPSAVKCGTCYRVDNLGPYGSASSSNTIFGSVVVEIVDACPAGNAQNYCKTDVPPEERCSSNQTNSLDIDISAYKELTKSDGTNPVNQLS